MKKLLQANKFELQCWFRHFYRQGPYFRQVLHKLRESASYTPEQLRVYQEQHLRKMVRHCYHNVPYYRETFRKLRLKPEDIRSWYDLEKLPFLDKHIVKENYDQLIATNQASTFCHIGHTSGSTGTPGKFLRDYSAINFENAAVWRHWNQAGDYGKRRVTLRGDIIVPASQSKPPFWKFNRPGNELLFSSYHLSLENSRLYVDRILAFRPAVLYCYPSTAYLLAKFFRMHNIDYKFQAIFSSSESVEPAVREYIEDTFGAKIYDWYGQAERVASIAQCPFGTYHILEDYSMVELFENPDGTCELIGTHLHNHVMPLLRYKTQDQIRLSYKNCPCGSHFRTVENVVGRNYSYLMTPEGYRVSITNHIPRGVNNLIETQFYQDTPGEVILKIITNGQFSETDRALLVKNTLEHTSPLMKVRVEEVSDIPRGPNGKFISIINNIQEGVQSSYVH